MEELKSGTTTVGIKFKDGVVLAADRQASMGYLVAHRRFKKIFPVTDEIALAMSGSVGDAQMILNYLRSEMKLYEMQKHKKPSVKACATLLANIMFSSRYFPYYIQLLIAGRDEDGYHVYTITPDGASVEDKFIAAGSGSVVAYGLLEDKYKEDMDMKEAVNLAVRAISVATKRDVYTGEGIDVLVITKGGIRELKEEEVKGLLS